MRRRRCRAARTCRAAVLCGSTRRSRRSAASCRPPPLGRDPAGAESARVLLQPAAVAVLPPWSGTEDLAWPASRIHTASCRLCAAIVVSRRARCRWKSFPPLPSAFERSTYRRRIRSVLTVCPSLRTAPWRAEIAAVLVELAVHRRSSAALTVIVVEPWPPYHALDRSLFPQQFDLPMIAAAALWRLAW